MSDSLNEAQKRIEELEEELAMMREQLAQKSLHADMAEIASSVLHNVSNVLNSLNILAENFYKNQKESKIINLKKLFDLLSNHKDNLAHFLVHDPKGQQALQYFFGLSQHLSDEQQRAINEAKEFIEHVQHAIKIIEIQQLYSKSSSSEEKLNVQEIIQDAIRINEQGLKRHGVKIELTLEKIEPVIVDRHKVLQILVNLINNAKYAVGELKYDKKIEISLIKTLNETFQISVKDNGMGISPEVMQKIFTYGFTTKKDGHGFGLYNGVLLAREMGGALRVKSEGILQGAEFTLELPFRTQWKKIKA